MYTLETYRMRTGDPLSATGETAYLSHLRRDDWSITTLTRTWLRLDTTHCHARAELEAYDGARRVFEKAAAFSIPGEHL